MTTSETQKIRRHFDPAYKLQVAKMIRQQGLSVSQVCKDMDLTTSTVHRWLQQYDAELAGHPGIGKSLTPEHQRIRELEKVHWFNHVRLLTPIGGIPPAETEANYWRQLATSNTSTEVLT